MKIRVGTQSGMLIIVAGIACALFLAAPASLTFATPCADCHTMHNSQGGSAIDTDGANEYLLVADCLSCHTAAPADSVSSFGAPKVLSTGSPTFMNAGGDFWWATSDNTYGHNVNELGGVADGGGPLQRPPGHHDGTTGWDIPGPAAPVIACGGVSSAATETVQRILQIRLLPLPARTMKTTTVLQ